jgi:MarR family 2-MHQ and catechol resistance regulon transcriptional repressor
MRKSAHSTPHPPPGGATGTSLKLWIVLSRAYDAVARHAAEDVAQHGLTIPEFSVLEVLYHKGPILLGEVQKRVLVSSGGTTFLVDRLVKKGFVRREACAEDRRASYAVLTPAGARLIARIFPVHAARIARATRGLTPAEQEAATALLRKLGLSAAGALEGQRPVRPDPPTKRKERSGNRSLLGTRAKTERRR